MFIVTTAEDCILSTPQTSSLQAGTITNYTTGAVELTQHYVPPSSLNSTGLSTTPLVIRLLGLSTPWEYYYCTSLKTEIACQIIALTGIRIADLRLASINYITGAAGLTQHYNFHADNMGAASFGSLYEFDLIGCLPLASKPFVFLYAVKLLPN